MPLERRIECHFEWPDITQASCGLFNWRYYSTGEYMKRRGVAASLHIFACASYPRALRQRVRNVRDVDQRLGAVAVRAAVATSHDRDHAAEHFAQPLAIERLGLDQRAGHIRQHRAVALQNLARAVVRLRHDPVDLAVDLARHLVAIVELLADLAAEEDQLFLLAERDRA